jgi:thiol-disulfide isomerase/thioredoxin
MLKNYFKKKSKFAIAVDAFIVVMLILLVIPATRKNTAALIIKSTLIIHQPKINKEKPKLNTETYNWQLQDLQGNTILLEEFKNKIVFINLWATWCPPCIAELPDLQKLYNKYGDKVVFLFISNESPEKISSFLKKREFNIPAYIPISQYPHDFETKSIPTSFLIDKKGKIVIDKKGVAKWNSKRIKNTLDILINSK